MTDVVDKQIQRKLLLDHFHNPRGREDIPDAYLSSASRNPMCGDEVEVGLRVSDAGRTDILFRGRGCSVCIASASIMVEICSGEHISMVRDEHEKISAWLLSYSTEQPSHASVLALESVRQLPARQRCMMLAWEALAESLDKNNADGSDFEA